MAKHCTNLFILLKFATEKVLLEKMFNLSVFNVKGLLVVILITSLVEGIRFSCKFQMLSSFYHNLGGRYTCIATIVNSGSTSLENVTEVHLTEKSNDDVEVLEISSQNLPFFPEEIGSFFKNLDEIWISNSSLTAITANDLRPFSGLSYLQLMNNQLTSIDGDLFKFTPHLQFVSFSHNQIKHIGHDLVTNLNILKVLNFQGNVCINKYAANRTGVLSLAPQLSTLCPPLETTTATAETTTTEATTTAETISTEKTTTEVPFGQCLCDEQIQELRELNRALALQIDNLQESNVERDKKIERQRLSIDQMIKNNRQQSTEIEGRSEEIKQLQSFNEKLVHENSKLAGKLLEIVKKLQEISFLPSAN